MVSVIISIHDKSHKDIQNKEMENRDIHIRRGYISQKNRLRYMKKFHTKFSTF